MTKQYEPKIIDGVLYGLELNSHEEPDCDTCACHDSWQTCSMYLKRFEAENNPQLVKVCESEYFKNKGECFTLKLSSYPLGRGIVNIVFTADKNDKNELINLKIC